jgi:hypothetical protein
MPANNINNGPWVIAKSSVIGRSHIISGIPCQDAHRVSLLNTNPSWGVVAVSDGAGSCSNSHLGSERVTETCVNLFTELLIRQGWSEGKPLPGEGEWRMLALAELQKVTGDLKSYSETLGVELHSLSATVIVMIFGPDAILLAHVGDGRAAGQNADGNWKALLTPYRGDEANVTVFITSNIWREDRINSCIGTEVFIQPFRAFAVMSDGCEMASFSLTHFNEKSQRYDPLNEPYAPFFDPNVAALYALDRQGKTEKEIDLLWHKLLTDGTQRFSDEPDDKTMVLAVNRNLFDIEPTAQEVLPESDSVCSADKKRNLKTADLQNEKPKSDRSVNWSKSSRMKKRRGRAWKPCYR